jgi:hypothetical protein
MAEFSQELIKTVLDLQCALLIIIHKATATSFVLFEQQGEIGAAATDLEQLDNVVERADNYYARLSTLLRTIARYQPVIPPNTMELLDTSIEQTQASIDALEASIIEINRNWQL